MRTVFALIVVLTCVSPAVIAAEKISEHWDLKVPDTDDKKAIPLHSAVIVEKNEKEVTLRNRGTLISKKDFGKGVYLELQWTWLEGGEKMEGEGPDARMIKYYDCLKVCLFSKGEQPNWSYEATDGIHIRFDPNGSTVMVELREEGKDPKTLLLINNMVFKKGIVYTIKIRADAEKEWLDIAVLPKNMHVNQGCHIPLKSLSGGKVVIYDRESVADIPKSSVVRNLKIVPKESEIVQK